MFIDVVIFLPSVQKDNRKLLLTFSLSLLGEKKNFPYPSRFLADTTPIIKHRLIEEKQTEVQ